MIRALAMIDRPTDAVGRLTVGNKIPKHERPTTQLSGLYDMPEKARNIMDKYDRYLRITRWARKRYEIKGILLIATGENWSKYSIIEVMAWNKYLA